MASVFKSPMLAGCTGGGTIGDGGAGGSARAVGAERIIAAAVNAAPKRAIML
jgi:hypothetical protein